MLLEDQLALETGHGQAATVARKEASPIPSYPLEAWGAVTTGAAWGLDHSQAAKEHGKVYLMFCISVKGSRLSA